jgi:two-component sensor histidine kinase/CHASE3 domain sensor protein
MPISSSLLVRSTFAYLAVGFLALTAIVAMNSWLSERAQTYFDDANLARDVRVAAVELRNSMLAAESSQRGFVITGNEIYLAPYQSAKAQAQRQLATLQRLLPSYPGGAPTLPRLSSILADKFTELDQTIALKRDQKDDDIRSIFRTNIGKALTDEANVYFAGIIGQADGRLTSGVAEQRANTGWVRLVSALSALVIVVVIGGAAYVIARYTSELRATRDQVNTINAELEQRVARRTSDLALARDRAELLLSEVNHRVANSLSLVSAMVNLQSKALDDGVARSALAETQDRIFAISLVHRRLYSSTDVGSVDLKEYLSGLLGHLSDSLRSKDHGVSLTYDIEAIELGTDASVSLGVVVTELVTNAVKYAYPDGVGDIRVRLARLGEEIELTVDDDGIGRTEGRPAIGTGVGSRIVAAMCRNLGSQIAYRDRNPGTSAQLVFPANPRQAAT